jgi:hypothetical protein
MCRSRRVLAFIEQDHPADRCARDRFRVMFTRVIDPHPEMVMLARRAAKGRTRSVGGLAGESRRGGANVADLGATGEVRDELSALVGQRQCGCPPLDLSCAALIGFPPSLFCEEMTEGSYLERRLVDGLLLSRRTASQARPASSFPPTSSATRPCRPRQQAPRRPDRPGGVGLERHGSPTPARPGQMAGLGRAADATGTSAASGFNVALPSSSWSRLTNSLSAMPSLEAARSGGGGQGEVDRTPAVLRLAELSHGRPVRYFTDNPRECCH